MNQYTAHIIFRYSCDYLLILLDFSPCISHQAINLLPANTQIREIRVFLESVMEEKAQRKRCNQVLKSLLQAEFLRVSAHNVASAN